MTIRRIDPDFESPRSKAPRGRGRLLLGAAPVLAGLLAGVSGFGSQQEPEPSSPPIPRRPWLRPHALPANPRTPREAGPPAPVPMLVPAPRGIDEAMIHRARPGLDPRMVVPALPDVEAAPAPTPYDPLWVVPMPPAPGFAEPGGAAPRR